jgi:hypothetical protein
MDRDNFISSTRKDKVCPKKTVDRIALTASLIYKLYLPGEISHQTLSLHFLPEL